MSASELALLRPNTNLPDYLPILGSPEAPKSDMRITYMHVPMTTVEPAGGAEYWQNFDRQYVAAHPGIRPMEEPVMWEMPHVAMWLGGVLEARGYENQDVLDLYTASNMVSSRNELSTEAVRRALLDHGESQAFLFSPMTVNTHFALEIARITKEIYPDSKTIFGGVMATPMHEWMASQEGVDYIVTGRGEVALPKLLQAIEQRLDTSQVKQLTYKDKSGKVVSTGGHYPDIHPRQLPPDKIDLFPADTGDHTRYIRQVHGLGCPYACSFCTIQTIGQAVNYFPVERVVSEATRYFDRFGKKHLYMGDETLTQNAEPLLALMDAFAEHDIEFDGQTRLNRLTHDPRIIPALGRGNCRWIEIGLESISEEASQRYKQRTKQGELRNTLQQIQDVGVAVCSFLVHGLPGQTPDQMKRSVEGAAQLMSDGLLQASYLAVAVPYPGSEMYANPGKFDMTILHNGFSQYHEDLPPVFTTSSAPDPERVHEEYIDNLALLASAMSRDPVRGKIPESYSFLNLSSSPHV